MFISAIAACNINADSIFTRLESTILDCYPNLCNPMLVGIGLSVIRLDFR